MNKNVLSIIVIAALGYFVDIYDILIFSIVRKSSLSSIGLNDEEVLKYGLLILNIQAIGMLIGGFIWGILGDIKGRIKILFASIILYSVANFLNAYVSSVTEYAILRFIAGIGLAGELGVGITLVVESMPKHIRGYGTSIVAGFGVLGASFAYIVLECFDWRSAFKIGGILGVALLFLRMKVSDSRMFEKSKNDRVTRGNFISLITNPKLLFKYIKCVMIGIPIWFVVGILITFSDKFGKELNIVGDVNPGRSIMFSYIGFSVGDFLSGIVSQCLKSRKKALYVFYFLLSLSVYLFFTAYNKSNSYFYFIIFMLGCFAGYWAMFITISSEQFGTNIRSTVTTTASNFVRSSLTIVSLVFFYLQGFFSYSFSAIITFIMVLSLAIWSAISLEETFNKDLDYNEKGI